MKYIVPISAIALLAISITACNNADEKPKTTATTSSNNSYKIVPLEQNQLNGEVRLPGVMEPFQFVQIYPKVNGFIKVVNVDRGSIVRKGQVLITLEAPEIEENVSASKLKYTQAHAIYLTSKDRYLRLLETSKTPGTVSTFDLEAARSRMLADSATAQGEYANYKAQQDMYSYLTVTAPFDGIITERNVHPGALVGPGAQGAKPMLILQQLSKLRLVVNVPEQYSTEVKDGAEMHFRVNALPGKDFTGKISRSSGSLSSNFRSETIEVDVPNTQNIFKPGMYAEVVLSLGGNNNAFVVPKTAVVTTTERKYVITVENGHAIWVDVTEGNQQGDSTEVFGSFRPGEEIVANASYQIKNGAAIK